MNPITLIVQFRVKQESKQEFIAGLKHIFESIQKEKTFIKASLHQDLTDPEKLLVYEVWNETPESFMANQMPKEYRSGYEKKLTALNVERSAAFYDTAAEWKSTT